MGRVSREAALSKVRELKRHWSRIRLFGDECDQAEATYACGVLSAAERFLEQSSKSSLSEDEFDELIDW